jgi:zinc ribbon protein
MLFFFGVRTRSKALAQLEQPCSKCSKPTIHTAVETKRWFTLFFVPVIPLGTNHLVRCNLCGLKQKCSLEQTARLTAKTLAAVSGK